MFGSYDGNFRSMRKMKKVDDGDICLSDGLAYFPLKAPYKEWTENDTQPQRTVGIIFNIFSLTHHTHTPIGETCMRQSQGR